ncbi:monovalent cation/H+ antiporter subunit A [Agrobacterium tumefaciens]|uniref:Monovalent cation/H+ antiporter subunit A n=1 Tax=Rhodovulum sulfidophilum TaxID=35806 RepID=A0A2W5MXI7_RHOSU|nr:monovalent cation/H+ antiporter subunit A [Agrobacterium tumefaciens]PZQ45922.1 MAG: monovalent cation/H+ antiporter subunit A [Rhodovulum sulfidophilum]CDN96222.1 Monovalent cation/H+ antiporter subunit A [Agrobacterium tumefaciens]
MVLWLVPLLPLLGAILPPLLIRSGRNVCANATGLVSLAALALLLPRAETVFSGGVERVSLTWIAQIGLNFSFRLDGLSLFFAAMILIIGLLVIVYARFYLDRDDPVGRFYAYLLLFQGAMLGVVLSDNLILLLIFWELTSLTSFLLIGYWRHRQDAREGARMALIVTGGGGLALIAGLMLLGHIAGTYEISELLTRGDIIKASPLYLPALLLILLGAFTKSAQFPFHFWLPHAMAAPTPVSAYLHSATMVKAGIFLLARFWPVLSGTDAWFLIVAPVGLATMLIAAWIAFFKDDLKGLLAFSTVSHLGLVTMLLGLGTKMGAVAAVFHILNHATFKAALFMSAGIVDHETGTRDLKRLGGLMGLMPVTATLALVAAASMAGVPFFNGFLSKEMMLEEAAHTVYAGQAWLFPVATTLGAVCSVAYSLRFAVGTFMGGKRHDYPRHPHDPPAGMWMPVALLAIAVVAIGVAPALVAGDLVATVAGAVTGGSLPEYHLALWHGFTPALFMSLLAFAGGAALLAAYGVANGLRLAVPRPDAKAMFESVLSVCEKAASLVTGMLHNGSLPMTLRIVFVTLVAVGLHAAWQGTLGNGARPLLPVSLPAVFAWLTLAGISVAVAIGHADRFLSLILTSVVGIVVALIFIQFSAPDLALTQITVDVVTTVLMLLALNLLPKQTPKETGGAFRAVDALIAIAGGLGVAALAYGVMTSEGPRAIADYYLANSKPGGGGTNVVNVILVDFRGYDTFAEIIVLGIAAISIYALLDVNLKGAALRRVRALLPVEEAGDAHPLILVVATRLLLPLSLAVGVYIFLRGHNLPGGGFIAGLVVAIALIVQYIASGYVWASERRRYDPHALIGAGVGIAGLAGVAPWVFGQPFLKSTFGYVTWPLVGKFELASAMVFDLGVFLTVVGVMVLSLARLSRVAQRVDPQPPGAAMDIPLENNKPEGA